MFGIAGKEREERHNGRGSGQNSLTVFIFLNIWRANCEVNKDVISNLPLSGNIKVYKDSSGGPAMRSRLSNSGDMGSILGQGTKILHISKHFPSMLGSPSAATGEKPACPSEELACCN